MWIRLLLLLAVGSISLLFVRGRRGARHEAIRRLLLVAFVGAAAMSVLVPQVWQDMADAVGVGRGTDLLLYALIVAFLGFVATSYLRFRDLQRQVTELSRRLALDEAPPARSFASSPDPLQAPAAVEPRRSDTGSMTALPTLSNLPTAPVAPAPERRHVAR